MKNVSLLLLVVLLVSCAKIPIHSLDMINVVIEEGRRMHRLNITLINKMFIAKNKEIDEFIENKYIPTFVKNIQEQISDDVDLGKELEGIIHSTSNRINDQRNAMYNALEQNRLKIITKLNEDFEIFEESNIDREQFVKVLEIVKNARLNNQKKSDAISKINSSFSALIGLVEKLI